MLYISHRINTVAQLQQTPTDHGVELDLRDHGDRLVLQHDPFKGDTGEDFEAYLKQYRHGLMILNVKSERIEHRVLELIAKYRIKEYFFLDSSFPMMRLLANHGEHRIAVRYSEFEPVESALAMAGQVEWCWVDCFTRNPLSPETYTALKQHFKLCIVSPELQGRPAETIADYAKELQAYPFDAVCTKKPEYWKHALGGSSRKAA